MKGTVKKLLPMIVLAVSASLMSSCGNKQGGLPQSNEYPVITIQSTNSEMSSSYPATIRGKQDIEIRPKISGFITKLCVDEGSVVGK